MRHILVSVDDRAIGVFDSGAGGLTVLSSCKKLLPRENFIYLADTANAPYGNKSREEILQCSLNCVDALIARNVKAVVIACNTATNVGAAELRRRHGFPIIGLEPAVKPAFEACPRGRILVLCTCATARQEKFLSLVERCGKDRAVIAPQPDLAFLIEKNIKNLEKMDGYIFKILSDYPDVSAVVLGCSHYVFIKSAVESFYGAQIPVFDGNDGAARMLKRRLEENNLLSSRSNTGDVMFLQSNPLT